jgi:CRISPR-associated protein Csm4
MTFHSYRLRFPDGLHIGRGTPEVLGAEATVPSDTLKAALQACAVVLGYEQARGRAFLEGFRLSSAYPWVGDTRFYPKPPFPLTAEKAEKEPGKPSPKDWKRVKYLAEPLFLKVLTGEKLDAEVTDAAQFNSGLLWDKKQESSPKAWTETEVRTRLQSREQSGKNDPTPFHVDRVLFAPGDVGLWFMVQYLDTAWQPIVEAALRLLADEGLGTDRNVGYGRFEWLDGEAEHIDWKQEKYPKAFISLGLYCPADEVKKALDWDISRFDLVPRGGYISSSPHDDARMLRKNPVWMLRDGALLLKTKEGKETLPGTLPGKILDVAPDAFKQRAGDHPHAILRCGNPIMLPCVPPNHSNTDSKPS